MNEIDFISAQIVGALGSDGLIQLSDESGASDEFLSAVLIVSETLARTLPGLFDRKPSEINNLLQQVKRENRNDIVGK